MRTQNILTATFNIPPKRVLALVLSVLGLVLSVLALALSVLGLVLGVLALMLCIGDRNNLSKQLPPSPHHESAEVVSRIGIILSWHT